MLQSLMPNNSSELEREVRKLFRKYDARSKSSTSFSGCLYEIFEIMNKGTIYFIRSSNGNTINFTNKYNDCTIQQKGAANLALLGFDENSEYFKNMVVDFNTHLKKYYL